MMRPLSEKKLDYILLTHFHDDHMGNIQLSNKNLTKEIISSPVLPR